jgi:hypothetical protein
VSITDINVDGIGWQCGQAKNESNAHQKQKPGFSLDKVLFGAPERPGSSHWLG